MASTAFYETAQSVETPTGQWTPGGRRRRTRVPDLLPQLGNTGTAGQLEIARSASLPRKTEESHRSFRVLESWVARVDAVNAGARIFSAIAASEAHEGTRELAEFTFDEISEDDRPLIVPGAIFYWSVGYQIDEFGGRSTASVVRFRRIHHWKPKELEAARDRAAEYADWFLGEDNVARGDRS